MNTYFKKQVLRSPVILNGERIQWETVGGDNGVKMVDDVANKAIFDILEGLANRRRLGVTRISAEIYEDLKKNLQPSRASASPSSVGPPIRVFNQESVLPKASSVGDAKVVGAAKIVDTTPKFVAQAGDKRPTAFQPRTKKASEIAAAQNEPTKAK